mgnify:CR=1 FL=1
MLFGDDTELTDRIIGCAIEIHKHLGPGLLECVYEAAMCNELRDAGIPHAGQIGVPLFYKGELISEHRPDLVVDGRVVVEVKSVERLDPIHTAQLLTYLRGTNLKTELVLNFNTSMMRPGIRRVVL